MQVIWFFFDWNAMVIWHFFCCILTCLISALIWIEQSKKNVKIGSPFSISFGRVSSKSSYISIKKGTHTSNYRNKGDRPFNLRSSNWAIVRYIYIKSDIKCFGVWKYMVTFNQLFLKRRKRYYFNPTNAKLRFNLKM